MGDSREYILVINGGSSSIKFLVTTLDVHIKILEGKIDHIGMDGTYISVLNHETGALVTNTIDDTSPVTLLMQTLTEHVSLENIKVVGHRVVHGGNLYSEPTHITEDVLTHLESIISFAPRHLPDEIKLIRACLEAIPSVPHIACFDTSFYKNLPRLAQLLPIPKRYEAQGIHRYGFHGLSYEFILHELSENLGIPVQQRKIIIAHLGSGASLTAIRYGKPHETSMGFTPNSGIPMGTRTGDIDPGFFEYCTQHEHMSPSDFAHMVNYESGYLGVSNTTADMEVLLQKAPNDPLAEEAIAFFCYHVQKQIGALIASINGIDVLVFTGGMGEKSPKIRKRICADLSFFGIALDDTANDANIIDISNHHCHTTVCAIPTSEETTIARHVAKTLQTLSQ